VHKQKQW